MRENTIHGNDTYNHSLATPCTKVSWGSIIAGAVTASAVSLILLTLGTGLGFASVSPWSHSNPSGVTFTAMAAIWLIIMQWVASGLGGYFAGRLRSKWVDMHNDEVFFRDTAHGFLAWALATIVTAALLSSAVTSALGVGAHSASMVATGAAVGASQGAASSQGNGSGNGALAYYSDSLFRSNQPNTAASGEDQRSETSRILATGMKNGGLSQNDKAYLAQQIAARTGISPAEAQQRVDNVIAEENADEAKIKEAADTARKTAATVSVFMFLSLLIGAFVASVAAALGGKHRDVY